MAVRNATRFQCERHQRELLDREALEAQSIQRALLPKSSPYIPGFAVSGFSIPAGAVGGDWFDFIPLGDGRWVIVLADVSGKGMAAALLMSATRGMLRSLAEACSSPAKILSRLNRLLIEDLPAGKFVTLVLCRVRSTAIASDFRERWPFAAHSAFRKRAALLEFDKVCRGTWAGEIFRSLSFATSRISIRSLQRRYHGSNESRRGGVRPSASASAPARVRRFTREPARKCSGIREWCRAQ